MNVAEWKHWIWEHNLGEFTEQSQIPRSRCPFLEVPIHKTEDDRGFLYRLRLPYFYASQDSLPYWERERTASMRANLKKGDILFDIGVEQGWLSAIYATFVGPENMVLFEPASALWPNIKAIWEENDFSNPIAARSVLIGEKTENYSVPDTLWPSCAQSDLWITREVTTWQDRMNYAYLSFINGNAPSSGYPVISIDDFCSETQITPEALTIDVEGAEMLVLKGAKQTLLDKKPLVWASLHPDCSAERYGYPISQINEYMAKLGYVGEQIAEDHEEHWIFYNPSVHSPIKVQDTWNIGSTHRQPFGTWRAHAISKGLSI